MSWLLKCVLCSVVKFSGAGTNLKVGAHMSCAFSLEKFFGRAPQFFGSTHTNIISHFGEHFHDGQYSMNSLLFAVLLLTVPPGNQPFVKVGEARVLLCPMESVPLVMLFLVSLSVCDRRLHWPPSLPTFCTRDISDHEVIS